MRIKLNIKKKQVLRIYYELKMRMKTKKKLNETKEKQTYLYGYETRRT